MSDNRNTPNKADAPERIWAIDEDHYADRNPHNVCATEYIRADIHKAEIERLRTDNEELQDEFNSHQEKLSNDFDTDLWVAVRNLLSKTKFNWSSIDPDGVTAEQAYEWLYEALERRETTEIERLRAALQRIVAMDQDYMKCRRYSDEIAREALKGGGE